MPFSIINENLSIKITGAGENKQILQEPRICQRRDKEDKAPGNEVQYKAKREQEKLLQEMPKPIKRQNKNNKNA